ncbi:MAG: hypothetical protein WCI78_17205 [Mycobacterium sp.]
MTTVNNPQATDHAEPQSNGSHPAEESDLDSDDYPSIRRRWAEYAENHPNSKRARVLRNLRALESRAIRLPVVGKIHAPEKHDVVYVVGMGSLAVAGVLELPVLLVLLGGHALVRQHQSRSLSMVGEIIEDVWGHSGASAVMT